MPVIGSTTELSYNLMKELVLCTHEHIAIMFLKLNILNCTEDLL